MDDAGTDGSEERLRRFGRLGLDGDGLAEDDGPAELQVEGGDVADLGADGVDDLRNVLGWYLVDVPDTLNRHV